MIQEKLIGNFIDFQSKFRLLIFDCGQFLSTTNHYFNHCQEFLISQLILILYIFFPFPFAFTAQIERTNNFLKMYDILGLLNFSS